MHPTDFRHRSFVYRRLEAAGCTWRERNGAAVAGTFPGSAGAAGGVGLADLSPLARWGVKGAGAVDWLRREGWRVPGLSNRAERMDDGAVVARLADGEALLLDNPADPSRRLGTLMEAELPAKCYAAARAGSHAWFRLAGTAGPDCLAKLCGVDLRLHRFADLAVAQTSLARLSAVIVRDDRSGIPAFHILADSASALYLWDCLMDAMAEFDGRLLGLDDLSGV